MSKRRRKRYYGMRCMTVIMVMGILLGTSGLVMRRTLLNGLAEYADAPAIALPLMVMSDPAAVRSAREIQQADARMPDGLSFDGDWDASTTHDEDAELSFVIEDVVPADSSLLILPEGVSEPETQVQTVAPAPEVTPGEIVFDTASQDDLRVKTQESAELDIGAGSDPIPEQIIDASESDAIPAFEALSASETPQVTRAPMPTLPPEETCVPAGAEANDASDLPTEIPLLAVAPTEAAATPAAQVAFIVPDADRASEDSAIITADRKTVPAEASSPMSTLPPAETLAPTATPRVISESYFNNTLFIGDSRTNGLQMWGRLGKATYFCGTGYSVFNVFDKKSSDTGHFNNSKLVDVLNKNRYNQIYIMLGFNESGYPYSSLIKQYMRVISEVHKAQPEARIILHGVMHASARAAAKYSYCSISNLERINDGLRSIAKENSYIYYVDCNEPFCDSQGYLLEHVSNDGEHLTPKYTKDWAKEILKRAVVA